MEVKMKYCILKSKGLILLTIVLNVLTSVASVYIAKLLQKIIDAAIGGNLNLFKQILMLSIIYIILLCFFLFLYSLFSKKLSCRIIKILRERVFNGILERNVQDFTKVNSADYISALTNDIQLIEDNYITPILVALQYMLIFLVTCVLLFQYSWVITLCLFFCMIVMILIPGIIGKYLQNKQNALSMHLSAFTSKTKDFLSGFDVIKSYKMEKHMKQEFNTKNELVYNSKYQVERLNSINEGISGILAYITQFSGLFLGAYFIIQGKISAGSLVAIVQLSSTFITPIMMILQNIPKIQSIKPIIDRLNELVDYKNPSFQGTMSPSFQKGIEVKDLEFSFDNLQPVLRNISLKIRKGKKYAVVGKSGCGKTTLVKVLTGNLDKYNGYVGYDDQELHNLDMKKLQDMISIIQQNVYIFDDSIQHNITLFEEYTSEEMDEALKISGVDQFIKKLPQGILTIAGENGSNLSGGERQRIAVARALIRNKQILVLDEGTSAVDQQTAYDIESRLLLIDDLTLITITHNLNEDLLKLYDEIIYIEDGKIVEVGALLELLQNKSRFYDFYTLQK